MPPTPTPFVPNPNADVIELPPVSLWDSVDYAVQTWNIAPDSITVFFQAIIIVGLIAGIAMILIRLINGVTTTDE